MHSALHLRLVPVLDIMNGMVVRAVAGRRAEYRPLVSPLTQSSDPSEIAAAMVSKAREFGTCHAIYVADLDAIVHRRPNLDLCQRLSAKFDVWLDAGIRTVADAQGLRREFSGLIVLGLETLDSQVELQRIAEAIGPDRLAFSLDLRDGKALFRPGVWPSEAPGDIAGSAVAAGIRRLIVLDLARVGVGGGLGTLELVSRIAGEHPSLDLVAGGGVRHAGDLADLQAAGAAAALVSSLLHEPR